MIKNDVASIKTVFRNFIIKKLFEMLGIKAVNGQLIIPEKCIYIPDMLINTTWGRIIKKHYLAFNALGLGKLKKEGLDPKQIGYLIKGLGLTSKRIHTSINQIQCSDFADYCTKKDAKKSEHFFGDKHRKIYAYKISGIEVRTQNILKYRYENKVSNVLTFMEKIKKDRDQHPDLYSYAKALQEQSNPDRKDAVLTPSNSTEVANSLGLGDEFINHLFNSGLDRKSCIDEINYKAVESDIELTPQQWAYLDNPENQANLNLYAGVIAQFTMQNEGRNNQQVISN